MFAAIVFPLRHFLYLARTSLTLVLIFAGTSETFGICLAFFFFGSETRGFILVFFGAAVLPILFPEGGL